MNEVIFFLIYLTHKSNTKTSGKLQIACEIENIFIGALRTNTKDNPKRLDHAVSLSSNASFGHQVTSEMGIIRFDWQPAQPEEVIVSRVATKTLKLGVQILIDIALYIALLPMSQHRYTFLVGIFLHVL